MVLHSDSPSKTPSKNDFLPSTSLEILTTSPSIHYKYCVILLHDHGTSEKSLETLATELQQKQKESVFIMLRGIHAIDNGTNGYHWVDENGGADENFSAASRFILIDIIKNYLLKKCGFRPRNIMLVGHSEGGKAALAAAASWNEVELGGIISIGGPLPAHTHLPQDVKAKTPVLILGGALGSMSPTTIRDIEQNFTNVDSHLRPGAHDETPTGQETGPLLEFFAHRLRREEWMKQAVISFGR